MSQGPRTWLLGGLDALLPENRRRAPPEELSRYRVLVGTTVLLLLFSVVLVLLASFFSAERVLMSAIGWGMAVGLGGVLLALRRGSPLRVLSLAVCGLLVVSSLVGTVLFSHVFPVSSHASVVLIPLLAVYLVGVRSGLAITGIGCVNAALLTPLLLSGLAAPVPAERWARGGIDAIALLLGWGVSALFGAAREATAATARESEHKLLSLLESTKDPVCSLDMQGRIITANSMARRMFLEAFGQELKPGDALDKRSSAQTHAQWRSNLALVFQGQSLRYEWSMPVGGQMRVLDLSLHPLRNAAGQIVGMTLFGRDISERKQAEAKLAELNRSLLDVSRQAGMAEVATDVLHNVGNTLNSVNVSASLVVERLRGSRAPTLVRATEMLREHAADLPAFLGGDSRGRQLPEYLSSAAQHLTQEHELLMEEMQGLIRHVEHIRAVVWMQQEHARVGGWEELVRVPELLDDALRLHASAFERLGIRIHREYLEVSPVLLDRHRLLQIVVNLLNNARHAMVESGREDKQLSIRVWREGAAWLHIEVGDNGVGIAPEHLPRLFTHGFTTKKEGHGFGLHASALAAEAMHGHLRCDSRGRGQGARFLIELPFREPGAQA